jgi:hypothetical protein
MSSEVASSSPVDRQKFLDEFLLAGEQDAIKRFLSVLDDLDMQRALRLAHLRHSDYSPLADALFTEALNRVTSFGIGNMDRIYDVALPIRLLNELIHSLGNSSFEANFVLPESLVTKLTRQYCARFF